MGQLDLIWAVFGKYSSVLNMGSTVGLPIKPRELWLWREDVMNGLPYVLREAPGKGT